MANKYRFKILNGCEVVDSYPFTSVFYNEGYTLLSFVVDEGETIPVGSYIRIEGLDSFGIYGNTYVPIVSSNSPGQVTIENIWGNRVTSGSEGTLYILYGWRYVNPMNWLKTKYAGENEGVRWRKSLQGSLLFKGSDYNYFLNYLNECCEIKFTVERLCGSGYVTDWEGYTSPNMGTWNLSTCEVEFEFGIDDAYRCLNANKSNKINIAPVELIENINIPYEIQFEEHVCCIRDYFPYTGLNDNCPVLVKPFNEDGTLEMITVDDTCIDNVANWYLKKWTAQWTGNITVSPNTAEVDLCCTWVREIAFTVNVGGTQNPPAGAGWQVAEVFPVGGDEVTKWYRIPFGRDNVNYDLLNYTEYLPIQSEDCLHEISTVFPSENIDYDVFREFSDVIEYLVSKTCGKVKGVRSDYFEINPVGDTTGYVAGVNYVTGDANKLRYIAIADKKDFLDLAEDVPYQEFVDIAFDTFMSALYSLLWCDWFIDDDGWLRIEHLSWFNRTVSIDTTTGYVSKLNGGKKKFVFVREDIPIREEYTCMEQGNIDFRGKPILYRPPCPKEDYIKQHSASPFTTDVTFVQNNPQDIERAGFVMVIYDGGGIDSETGELTLTPKHNAHLSWANLHQAYHRHLRPLISGNMNGSNVTFESAKPSKKQSGIMANGCCIDVHPMIDLITSELGDGVIIAWEKSNQTEYLTFDLLHE